MIVKYNYKVYEAIKHEGTELDDIPGESNHWLHIADCPEPIPVCGINYPNVYYTILLDDGIEKQTIASRLAPLGENVEEVSSGSSGDEHADTAIIVNSSQSTTKAVVHSTLWKVDISHGLKGKYVLEVDPDWSIAEMKMKVAEITGVPAARQKLMCKGSMLKSDLAKIIDTKITNECKISLIGNIATSSSASGRSRK